MYFLTGYFLINLTKRPAFCAFEILNQCFIHKVIHSFCGHLFATFLCVFIIADARGISLVQLAGLGAIPTGF